jgi:hypothetical protein
MVAQEQQRRGADERDAAQREIDLESRETAARLSEEHLADELSELVARGRRVDQRDRLADERDLAADERQTALDRREVALDDRDRLLVAGEAAVDWPWLDQREIDLEGRDSRAQLEEQAVTARETVLRSTEELADRFRDACALHLEVAQRREQLALLRETAAGLRQLALDEREQAAGRREHLADLRQARQDLQQGQLDELAARLKQQQTNTDS